MVEYTLAQLLEDAAARQQRTSASGQGAALKQQLAEVWQTVDRYISACLEQRRGVVLQNLCRVGWQAVKLRGKSTFRPYFQISDSFCRSYNASPARGAHFMQDEDVCPMEDFNFSKAAIRFSSQLTKDHVSAGLRALVQQLGQAVGQGRSVSLEFSFGRLLSEDRTVRMAFAPELYVANGLEAPSSGGGAARGEEGSHRPAAATFTPAAPSEASLRGLSVSGTGALEGGGRAASLSARRHGSAAAGAADVFPGSAPEDAEGGACGGGPELLRSAYDDALHRQISALETRASEALRDKAELEGQMLRGRAMDAQVRAVRQAQRRENAEFLQQQIEESRSRKDAEKAASLSQARDVPMQKPPLMSRIDIAAMHRRDMLTSQAKEEHAQELASVVSGPSGAATARPPSPSTVAASQGSRSGAQREFREALEQQIQANRERREAMQQFERRVEVDLLAAESREVSARREMEEAARAQERATLNAAWKEESRIRDVRRAIEAIEHGRGAPGSKAAGLSVAGGQPPLTQRQRPPPWASEPGSWPGSSGGGGSGRCPSPSGALSARRASEAGPRSARGGEALGAAATLALQAEPHSARSGEALVAAETLALQRKTVAAA
uniref:CCDC81 HU domain-containing protein n=1 Tax=Alexandrium monilatum TaxID=311494 RepID=A0A7S4Q8D3_9DINO